MKNLKILSIIIVFAISSCVQKTINQTVTLYLDVSGQKNIETVGVRGQGKPLSWTEDLKLIEIKKDSIYKVTVNGNTGRLCTEIKFTINGNFEFQDQDNRKVYFDKSGTTIFKAKFNVR